MSHFSRLFDRFRQPSSPPRETAAVEGRWLVAGLGNPGGRYKDSRHNTGFMAATYLASRYGIELTRNKFSGLFGDARIADAPAIIPTGGPRTNAPLCELTEPNSSGCANAMRSAP